MFLKRKKKEEITDDMDMKPLDLEKGDLTAIVIAAFIVILPVLLIFIAVMLGAYWLFIGRF